jgi:phenylacetate-CoA ligase
VEARADLALEHHASQALLLTAKLKDRIGISAQIQIQPSGSLPRSGGKAQRVRDGRKG